MRPVSIDATGSEPNTGRDLTKTVLIRCLIRDESRKTIQPYCKRLIWFSEMARPERFERPTLRFVV